MQIQEKENIKNNIVITEMSELKEEMITELEKLLLTKLGENVKVKDAYSVNKQ